MSNGRRNPCFERFVLTLSPRFDDVLPNIPNPPSPWKAVTGTRGWHTHGAGDRVREAAYWRTVHRWSMTELVETDHETDRCDDNASFIKEFGLSTAYGDGLTAVSPWSRVNYDARVPGAGTFAAVFYACGETLLLQKSACGGQAFSTGNTPFLYCGLTDGNYAQDPNYRFHENPWLVDFDLRCLHPLCCNFGMGPLDMFYPGKSAPSDSDVAIDRFLAATVAFGHPGFLLPGRDGELRSYYMLQALASRYTQVSAETIRYADADGALHETSAALANGAYTRSQVVTRYSDGTITAANGHPDARMAVTVADQSLDLPSNGYWGRSGEGAFSYRVRRGTSAPAAVLACARERVKPGERVVIRGAAEHAVTIPEDAHPGARLWFEREGAWIDFTVEEPLHEAQAVSKGRPPPP